MLAIAIVLLVAIPTGFVAIRRRTKPSKLVVPIEPDRNEPQIETGMSSSVGVSESASRISGPPQGPPALNASPSVDSKGVVGDDGYEWLEFPEDSGKHFYRAPGADSWETWDERTE